VSIQFARLCAVAHTRGAATCWSPASAAFNDVPVDEVPADAVTASASGLDPGISPDHAALQVARVVDARGATAADVEELVDDATHGRTSGSSGRRT